ncbi:hypothetical protein SUGI_0454290 [Cryptomeria japonica]|nr:hypothetical protein SUGI_0454290 [Cryptomeria japonica]
MIEEFHGKYGTSHGSADATVHQILKVGYYWPSIFKDTHEHVRHCHMCQTATSRERNPAMPLQPVFEVRPFTEWALDFIGVINPNSSIGHKFILMATDYCTQWTEAIACRNATIEVVLKFIEEHIVTRFGMSFALVCDNGPAFTFAQLMQWSYEYKVILKFSSNYYPQGNGVAESTNKNILDVIKKLLEKNPRDWHNQLRYALWADRTRVKAALGTSPYYLVYG